MCTLAARIGTPQVLTRIPTGVDCAKAGMREFERHDGRRSNWRNRIIA